MKYRIMFVVLFFIVCVNGSSFAQDKLQLKEGLYVPLDSQCYNADSALSLQDNDIIIDTMNGVFGYVDIDSENVAKKIKKDGNHYEIFFSSAITVPMFHRDRNFTRKWIIESDDNKSFILINQIDNGNKLFISNGKFKQISYKYCGKGNAESPSNTTSSLTGDWSGTFNLKNPNGKQYTLSQVYTVYPESTGSSSLRFRLVSRLTFDKPGDIFGCSGTNSYSNTYEGDVVTEAEVIKFIQKTIQNQACGEPGTDIFRMNGDTLEAVNANGGKITSGKLTKK